MPTAACQLGLTASLLVNNGRDNVPDRLTLMALCPRQHGHDILVETSSRRPWRCRVPDFA